MVVEGLREERDEDGKVIRLHKVTGAPNTSRDLPAMVPLTRPRPNPAHKNESHKWDS
jgi:hypothetical protein